VTRWAKGLAALVGVAAGVLGASLLPPWPVLHEWFEVPRSAPPPTLRARGAELLPWMDQQLLDSELSLQPPSEEVAAPPGEVDQPSALEKQREDLYRVLLLKLELEPSRVEAVRKIFEASDWMGQGNPKVTRHPMSQLECEERRQKSGVVPGDEAVCGAKNMVALFRPDQPLEEAAVCMDQYEFPNVPCEYPVVWVRADEASALCRALDKRLCDSHEWEGACAGELLPPEQAYDFDMPRMQSTYFRNLHREVVWATLSHPGVGVCATGSAKSPGCVEPSWQSCGTNSYPAGAFPGCVSSYGVYDLHGNVAEHMSYPRRPEELGRSGGTGETELKGSWFGFDLYRPHESDCRWRAPEWHVTPVAAKNSHRNYHLGFRCCRDLE
jgi:formylglycine-generating enzyme